MHEPGDRPGKYESMAQGYALGAIAYEIIASLLLFGGLGWLLSLILPIGSWGIVVGLVFGLVVGMARFIMRGLAFTREQERERKERAERDSRRDSSP
jgi:F0F1-type ATP synthase assembly protein I